MFARQYSLFLTLVQFGGYTCFVVAQRGVAFGALGASKRPSTVPFRYSLGLAVSQALMQAFSNLAMQVRCLTRPYSFCVLVLCGM